MTRSHHVWRDPPDLYGGNKQKVYRTGDSLRGVKWCNVDVRLSMMFSCTPLSYTFPGAKILTTSKAGSLAPSLRF